MVLRFPQSVSTPSRRGAAGFTVLEIVIVLAVLGVLSGIALVSMPRHGFAASEVARILAADLARARTEAIRLNANVAVRVGSGGYEVFLDTDKDGVANRDRMVGEEGSQVNELDLNEDGTNDLRSGRLASFSTATQFPQVSISKIAIAGGGDKLWFDVRGLPRQGGLSSASASGEFTITAGASNVIVRIEPQGRIRVVRP